MDNIFETYGFISDLFRGLLAFVENRLRFLHLLLKIMKPCPEIVTTFYLAEVFSYYVGNFDVWAFYRTTFIDIFQTRDDFLNSINFEETVGIGDGFRNPQLRSIFRDERLNFDLKPIRVFIKFEFEVVLAYFQNLLI